MSSLVVTIIALLSVIQSALKVSGTEVDLTVKPGNNVTLYCDCSWTLGAHFYWYRNCSHYRQPPLEILTHLLITNELNPLSSSYQPIVNSSSNSYDLLIKNITESELGLYYCSVATSKVIDNDQIHSVISHSYGNITYKLSFEDAASSPAPTCPAPPDDGQCWSLLVILCPVCSLLSALISSTCVYCYCRCKTAPVEPGERSKRREGQTGKQDEDKELCYASLDMPARLHKAKPKRTRNQTQNSDFSTYSEAPPEQSKLEEMAKDRMLTKLLVILDNTSHTLHNRSCNRLGLLCHSIGIDVGEIGKVDTCNLATCLDSL